MSFGIVSSFLFNILFLTQGECAMRNASDNKFSTQQYQQKREINIFQINCDLHIEIMLRAYWPHESVLHILANLFACVHTLLRL